MFPAMVFGMAILGVIIIPAGFHILSVIGGLALLLGNIQIHLFVTIYIFASGECSNNVH